METKDGLVVALILEAQGRRCGVKNSHSTLIRSKARKEALAKAAQKPKDDKLWPEEEKVARLYKAGKLKRETFDNLEDLEKDLSL